MHTFWNFLCKIHWYEFAWSYIVDRCWIDGPSDRYEQSHRPIRKFVRDYVTNGFGSHVVVHSGHLITCPELKEYQSGYIHSSPNHSGYIYSSCLTPFRDYRPVDRTINHPWSFLHFWRYILGRHWNSPIHQLFPIHWLPMRHNRALISWPNYIQLCLLLLKRQPMRVTVFPFWMRLLRLPLLFCLMTPFLLLGPIFSAFFLVYACISNVHWGLKDNLSDPGRHFTGFGTSTSSNVVADCACDNWDDCGDFRMSSFSLPSILISSIWLFPGIAGGARLLIAICICDTIIW